MPTADIAGSDQTPGTAVRSPPSDPQWRPLTNQFLIMKVDTAVEKAWCDIDDDDLALVKAADQVELSCAAVAAIEDLAGACGIDSLLEHTTASYYEEMGQMLDDSYTSPQPLVADTSLEVLPVGDVVYGTTKVPCFEEGVSTSSSDEMVAVLAMLDPHSNMNTRIVAGTSIE
ncbi:hypothetical protein Bhyg_07560, partial [Pseudolycoriella hygida]